MSAGHDQLGPFLLVSDIDDTLTGDRAALVSLCQVLSCHRSRIKVALNSSRPAASVDETLASYFPSKFKPDAVITGLGTEIRIKGEYLKTWSQQFETWPDAEIRQIVTGLGYAAHELAFQTSGKASFAVPGPDHAKKVLHHLKKAGFAFKHIFSGASDLDILAPEAGKDAALRHLTGCLRIAPEHTIAAGDSGNDLALFQAAGQAIAVGNARPELLAAMPSAKTYHATACHAGGVLEGLRALKVLPDSGTTTQ